MLARLLKFLSGKKTTNRRSQELSKDVARDARLIYFVCPAAALVEEWAAIFGTEALV